MKPYYQDELLTIYNADCRKVLPWLERCDLLLTDPPYGMDYQSNMRDISLKKIENDSDLTLVSELVNMAILKLWAHRHAYIFGRYDFDLTRFKGVHELIWNKDEMTAGDLTMPWGKSYEVVTFGIRVDCDSNLANSQKRGELPGRLRKKSILTYRRLAGLSLVHPTQKPVALLREFIESSSHFGELVLDPFMGSGSTLVAAKLEGRRAIGIELDESYCAAAVKRIETETTNIQLKII